jgi:hypothetical protein
MPGRTLHALSASLSRPPRPRIPFPRPRYPRHHLRAHLHAQEENQYLDRARRSETRHQKVDDGIWLVSFINYDLGYIDREQKTLQTIDNPFGTRLSPMS